MMYNRRQPEGRMRKVILVAALIAAGFAGSAPAQAQTRRREGRIGGEHDGERDARRQHAQLRTRCAKRRYALTSSISLAREVPGVQLLTGTPSCSKRNRNASRESIQSR